MIKSAKTKKWIFVIAIVLVSVALSALLGNLTKGFQEDISFREVNPDNLYHSFLFKGTDGVLATGEDGISAKLTDDNVIEVSGIAESAQVIEIGSYTLEAGKSYVFDSSLNNGTKGTVYMALSSASQTWPCYADPIVITVTENTTVTLKLMIANEYDVGSITLKPILCEGVSASDAVSFYK